MDILNERLVNAVNILKAFFKWVLVAGLIGAVGGLVGTLFYKSVVFATDFRTGHPWLIYLLPVGGLAIVFLYKISKTEGKNTNDIIVSILQGKHIPFLLVPVILASTVITHLLGGSAGREGAALQIGGGIGCNIGKLLHLDERDTKIAVLSGMAAVFSALFGTPITATVFALEVCSIGIIHYSGLLPCSVASAVAFLITRLFGIAPTHFVISVPELDLVTLVQTLAVAFACAYVSILFCRTMHLSNHLAEKYLKNTYVRIMAGGILLIIMTAIVGSQKYNGGGVETIAAAIAGESQNPLSFLIKALFTAVTLACGFKGGEIVPTFFIGACVGNVIGAIVGLPIGFASSIGLIATFCGAVNCPLASLVLSVEMFGGEGLIFFAFACFISYVISGYTGLYEEQKILYSKTKPEYINVKTF